MNHKTVILLFAVIAGLVMPFMSSHAAISLMDNVSGVCEASGECSVCDILAVIFNVGRLIFISMSGIALIMLLWAGSGFILNMGSAEAVAKNKKLILHTLLAILIILVAYTLVNMLIYVLAGKNLGAEFTNEFWKKGWFSGPRCK